MATISVFKSGEAKRVVQRTLSALEELAGCIEVLVARDLQVACEALHTAIRVLREAFLTPSTRACLARMMINAHQGATRMALCPDHVVLHIGFAVVRELVSRSFVAEAESIIVALFSVIEVLPNYTRLHEQVLRRTLAAGELLLDARKPRCAQRIFALAERKLFPVSTHSSPGDLLHDDADDEEDETSSSDAAKPSSASQACDELVEQTMRRLGDVEWLMFEVDPASDAVEQLSRTESTPVRNSCDSKRSFIDIAVRYVQSLRQAEESNASADVLHSLHVQIQSNYVAFLSSFSSALSRSRYASQLYRARQMRADSMAALLERELTLRSVANSLLERAAIVYAAGDAILASGFFADAWAAAYDAIATYNDRLDMQRRMDVGEHAGESCFLRAAAIPGESWTLNSVLDSYIDALRGLIEPTTFRASLANFAWQRRRTELAASRAASLARLTALPPGIDDFAVFEAISADRIALFREIVCSVERLLGPPPESCRYALLSLGSMASASMSLYSDVEFALIYESADANATLLAHVDDAVLQAFADIYARVDKLAAAAAAAAGDASADAVSRLRQERASEFRAAAEAELRAELIVRQRASYDTSVRTYFTTLLLLIELEVVALGETSPDPLSRRYARGFCFDDGGNTPLAKGQALFATPAGLARLLVPRSDLVDDLILVGCLPDCGLLHGSAELYVDFRTELAAALNARHPARPAAVRRVYGNVLLGEACSSSFAPVSLWATSAPQLTLNVKSRLYRMPSLALHGLWLYFGLQLEPLAPADARAAVPVRERVARLVAAGALAADIGTLLLRCIAFALRLRNLCHAHAASEADEVVVGCLASGLELVPSAAVEAGVLALDANLASLMHALTESAYVPLHATVLALRDRMRLIEGMPGAESSLLGAMTDTSYLCEAAPTPTLTPFMRCPMRRIMRLVERQVVDLATDASAAAHVARAAAVPDCWTAFRAAMPTKLHCVWLHRFAASFTGCEAVAWLKTTRHAGISSTSEAVAFGRTLQQAGFLRRPNSLSEAAFADNCAVYEFAESPSSLASPFLAVPPEPSLGQLLAELTDWLPREHSIAGMIDMAIRSDEDWAIVLARVAAETRTLARWAGGLREAAVGPWQTKCVSLAERLDVLATLYNATIAFYGSLPHAERSHALEAGLILRSPMRGVLLPSPAISRRMLDAFSNGAQLGTLGASAATSASSFALAGARVFELDWPATGFAVAWQPQRAAVHYALTMLAALLHGRIAACPEFFSLTSKKFAHRRLVGVLFPLNNETERPSEAPVGLMREALEPGGSPALARAFSEALAGCFSNLFVLSLLVRPCRASADDFALLPDGAVHWLGLAGVFCVDLAARRPRGRAASVLGALLSALGATADQSTTTRSILYCMDAMHEPLAVPVATALCHARADVLLACWLEALSRYNASVRELFSSEDILDLAGLGASGAGGSGSGGVVGVGSGSVGVGGGAGGGQCILPFVIRGSTVCRLFERLLAMQCTVQRAQAAGRSLTHLELLCAIEPSAASAVRGQLRQTGRSPMARYEALEAREALVADADVDESSSKATAARGDESDEDDVAAAASAALAAPTAESAQRTALQVTKLVSQVGTLLVTAPRSESTSATHPLKDASEFWTGALSPEHALGMLAVASQEEDMLFLAQTGLEQGDASGFASLTMGARERVLDRLHFAQHGADQQRRILEALAGTPCKLNRLFLRDCAVLTDELLTRMLVACGEVRVIDVSRSSGLVDLAAVLETARCERTVEVLLARDVTSLVCLASTRCAGPIMHQAGASVGLPALRVLDVRGCTALRSLAVPRFPMQVGVDTDSFVSLQSVNVEGHAWPPELFQAIVELRAGRARRSLSLDGQDIRVEAMVQLAAASREHGTLQVLRLANLHLSDKQMNPLAECVRYATALERVALRRIGCVHKRGAALLCEALARAPALVQLYMAHVRLSGLPGMLDEACTSFGALSVLSLRACDVGLGDVKRLAEFVCAGGMPQLSSLDLGRNKLGASVVEPISAILEHSTVNTLNLDGVALANKGMIGLCVQLARVRSLTALSLRGNELSYACVRDLTTALRAGPALMFLDLAENPFADEGAALFAACLRAGTLLQLLRLRACSIQPLGISLLREAVQEAPMALRVLDARCNVKTSPECEDATAASARGTVRLMLHESDACSLALFSGLAQLSADGDQVFSSIITGSNADDG